MKLSENIVVSQLNQAPNLIYLQTNGTERGKKKLKEGGHGLALIKHKNIS